MNVNLPQNEKIGKRTVIIYIIAIIVCIIAIGILIGTQILGTNVVDSLFGISSLTTKTREEEERLRNNFESIFDNQLEYKEEVDVKKIDKNKDIIYTYYEQTQNSLNNYDVKINIPFINIENEEVKKFNNNLRTFENKAQEVLKSEGQSVIYNVKYKAYIDSNLLSLIVYSELKEGINPQRLIIQTFCFNIKDNKEMSLEDVLKMYDLDKNAVQDKILSEIRQEEEKSNELKSLGYNVFSRDVNSEIYKIQNTTEFFIYDSNVYIIYPYGNNMFTSEIDIIVL